MNIAIDGPSGAGKSTVAKLISSKLGIAYLDTGAMYRAAALKADRLGLLFEDETIKTMLQTTYIDVFPGEYGTKVFLDSEDVSEDIRKHYISALASDISAIHSVRLFMVELQRKIAAEKDSVLDGRDIGTFVLPNAKFKFYLTATEDERALRRQKELQQKGEIADFETVKRDIINRDYNDMHRDFAPLRQANDAILIDTTNISATQVCDIIIDYINQNK